MARPIGRPGPGHDLRPVNSRTTSSSAHSGHPRERPTAIQERGILRPFARSVHLIWGVFPRVVENPPRPHDLVHRRVGLAKVRHVLRAVAGTLALFPFARPPPQIDRSEGPRRAPGERGHPRYTLSMQRLRVHAARRGRRCPDRGGPQPSWSLAVASRDVCDDRRCRPQRVMIRVPAERDTKTLQVLHLVNSHCQEHVAGLYRAAAARAAEAQ